MDKHEIYHAPAANIRPWNRSLCGVLEEMRECYKTRNFAALPGLIEEAQSYGNRMEAKLTDVKDYTSIKERYNELKQKVEELEKQTGEEKRTRSPLHREW